MQPTVDRHNMIVAETKTSVIYTVSLAETGWHKNRVPCLLIGNRAPIAIETATGQIEGDALFVAPGYDHRVLFGDQEGHVMYLECLRPTGSGQLFGSPATPLSAHQTSSLLAAMENWSTGPESEVRNRLFAQDENSDVPRPLLNTIQTINSDPSLRMGQNALSAALGLERTQSLKAFKAATGMTLRSYQIWKALRTAIGDVVQGGTLQSAGLDSGFCDAPHFSRSVRATFGLSPSSLL